MSRGWHGAVAAACFGVALMVIIMAVFGGK